MTNVGLKKELKHNLQRKKYLIEVVPAFARVFRGKVNLNLLTSKIGCDTETLEAIISELLKEDMIKGWEIDTLSGILKVDLSESKNEEEKKGDLGYSCFKCGELIKPIEKNCTSCGSKIIRCKICDKPISMEDDILLCIGCSSEFHKNHLIKLIHREEKCPVCRCALEQEWYSYKINQAKTYFAL